mgnify:FL=1
MSPSLLPEVKQEVLNTRVDMTEPLVEQILQSPFHDEIYRLFEQINRFSPDHS